MAGSDVTAVGYLTGPGLFEQPVTYAVVDGRAIYEGCIDMGPADEVAAQAEEIAQRRALRLTTAFAGSSDGAAPGDVSTSGVGLPGDSTFLWTNGRVAYEIDGGVPDPGPGHRRDRPHRGQHRHPVHAPHGRECRQPARLHPRRQQRRGDLQLLGDRPPRWPAGPHGRRRAPVAGDRPRVPARPRRLPRAVAVATATRSSRSSGTTSRTGRRRPVRSTRWATSRPSRGRPTTSTTTTARSCITTTGPSPRTTRSPRSCPARRAWSSVSGTG